MISFIMLLTTILSTMFMFMSHPLSFGMILLLQTLLISMMTGLMNSNFWFSYILFLVMVGGMLVLFLYMTSVASNEKFMWSFKLFVNFTLLMIISFTVSMIIDSFLESENIYFQELEKIFQTKKYLNKYLNFPSSPLLFLIISYLLIVMIMVVKMTDSKYGPIRQKF
uniref:NADH-ubiquinone oxidoreductase chain 6 n=1 Tax=Cerambycidae sp. 1 KM-2017 TaxID=2219286 RepID=A0A346RJH1_9CUCU|nr:NADH dehydrogenase subunit 6 [Cerambycidae sp. 1 KM-2017]